MSFIRQTAESWHRDVPGARWFKTDLHVHTIDDRAGGRAQMPKGLSGDPTDPGVLTAYARRFLQAVSANGVQVVGLTPHSPRIGDSADTSAVWKIVEEWNTGIDDHDDTPFREKIFAVFPGFEPNVNDGAKGVHILFLFDPEIGRERYLRLFDAIMDGRSPWNRSSLQPTPRDARAILATIEQSQSESNESATRWHYLALAPHFQGSHGVFQEMRSRILARFPCDRFAGYELGDDKLPEEITENKKPGEFLLPFMRQHRQAFFHSSDAYSIAEIGQRHTWMKLASPRIEALRQAFIASDSRMRIAFCRDEEGVLQEVPDPPDVTINERPWLKTVTVCGRASFFGVRKAGSSESTRFELSPELTCIIGGSMTGKSTLLDGLRLHIGASLPDDKSIREQVEARGRDRFLSGSPEIRLEAPGSDPSAEDHMRWPARFFAQSELQRLAEAGSIEDLLARLAPSEATEIEERRATLQELDRQLAAAAGNLAGLDEKLAEAEQDHARASRARQELDAFKGAGVDKLHVLGRRRQAWMEVTQEGRRVGGEIDDALASVRSFSSAEMDEELTSLLTEAGIEPAPLDLDGCWSRIVAHLQSARDELTAWMSSTGKIASTLNGVETATRVEVERALARQGLDASKLKEFQKLNRQAALRGSYAAQLEERRNGARNEEHSFSALRQQRCDVQQQQREAFDRVLVHIARQFGGRIRARRIENGDLRSLDHFLSGLAQRGVSRWWNGLEPARKPSPESLLVHFEGDTLDRIGMSPTVRQTFRELFTKARQRALAALRAPDAYVLELRLDDGSYRPLEELSGGQRVSVLLSLLLETADDRPLVIDQPEDELDNRFLWETILPALKKLKGRRQIIVATHNPNIVVNGDADMVIQLEATAQRGYIAVAGAIEEPEVRDAIVRTVDGGDEAFRLRRRKYGF